jgi:hypothetical protein
MMSSFDAWIRDLLPTDQVIKPITSVSCKAIENIVPADLASQHLARLWLKITLLVLAMFSNGSCFIQSADRDSCRCPFFVPSLSTIDAIVPVLASCTSHAACVFSKIGLEFYFSHQRIELDPRCLN